MWEYVNEELEEGNFVKIYTSKVIRANNCDQQQSKRLLDYLITGIGDNEETAEGIRQMHITQQEDIVVGFQDEIRAQTIIE